MERERGRGRGRGRGIEEWSFVSRDLLGLGRRSCLFGLVVLMRMMRPVGLETRERQMGGWRGVCRNGRELELEVCRFRCDYRVSIDIINT